MKLLNLIKKQTVNQTMNAFYVQVPPSDCPHHLIHRTDTDMEIPTCILLLLMFMTSLLKSAPILTVREIEGSLTVKEKVDLTRMQKHAHLWAQELLTEKDKLNSLTAAQKIRELSLLTLTLQSLTNYTTTETPALTDDIQKRRETWGNTVQEDKSYDNYLRRSKRNILGDIVHVITGLATDEMLQQQLKIDEAIRDKVANTLAKQVSFEQTMASIYGNLTKEEETLHSMVLSLQSQHNQDKAKQARMTAYQSVVLEDIDRLEDQIEAVWTGHVNTRHAAFLSTRAGLSQVAAFTYTSSSTEGGLTLSYSARMFSSSPIKTTTISDGILNLETMDRAYLLHPAFDLDLPITELEVRSTRAECRLCAKLVHTGHSIYIATQGGQLTCKMSGGVEEVRNVTKGQRININKPDTCWNQLLTIGGAHLRLKEYVVDTSGDDSLDLLLVHKATKDSVKMETPSDTKTTHTLLNLQLRHDLQEAKEDMSNFVVDTSLELNKGAIMSTISWGWMAAITSVVLIIVILFALRVKQMCQTAKSQADT